MKWLTVKQRLLLITVLPLLVITLLLTSYMVVTRQTDKEAALREQGSSMVSYLASASEFAIFAGNERGLQRLADTVLDEQNVRSVRFFNAREQLLFVNGKAKTPTTVVESKGELVVTAASPVWIFQMPVYYSELDVDEFGLDAEIVAGDTEPVLGWVQLVMDEQQMRDAQQTVLTTSLALGGVGFLVLMMLASYVARGISRPLSELTQAVKVLESGHLNKRVEVDSGGELAVLAHGINSLAASVEQSSEELNFRVIQATRRLTYALAALEVRNKELETAREETLRASTAKGDFLARMSHELRTPLTAVAGYAKLLRSMPLTDSQEEYLQNISCASEILLSTINDILDFSRLESGMVTLEQLPFCLQEVCENVLAMHALNAHQKNLELVLFLDPEVPSHIVGDALRLRQVLTNLLSNAVKFTDYGQVVLRTEVVQLVGQRAVLRFIVKDSGIGISEVHNEQLFSAFSQADKTITRRFGGTGLGLAIAKELTLLMGGEINIASEPGKGTEVSITIECEQVDNLAEDEGKTQPRLDSVASEAAGKLYIYDQNPWVRRALRAAGIEYSTSVSVVASVEKLIDSLLRSELKHEIVILGLTTQELKAANRDQLLDRVRQVFSGPIVLLASIEMSKADILEDDCTAFGPLYVRSKPIRKKTLKSVLALAQSYLQGRARDKGFSLPGQTQSNRLQGMKILVAEDNDFNRNLICAVVKAEGGQAIAARDGIEALKEVHAQHIDLVLMDLNMPRLNGQQAVRELKRSGASVARLPVIALTATAIDEDDRYLLAQGFERILFKPLDEEKLIGSIVELVKGEQDAVTVLPAQASFLSALPVEVLNDEVQRQLESIRKALENEDLNLLRDQAHQLRGVLYGVAGSEQVIGCVGKLELACDGTSNESLHETFAMLESMLEQVLNG